MNIVEQNITKFVDSLIIDDFSTAHTFLENVINEKIKITIAEEAKKNPFKKGKESNLKPFKKKTLDKKAEKKAAKNSAFGGGKFPQAKSSKLKKGKEGKKGKKNLYGESVSGETLMLRSVLHADLFQKMKDIFMKHCHGEGFPNMEIAYTLGKVDMDNWGNLLDEIDDCMKSSKDTNDVIYLKEIRRKIADAGSKIFSDEEEFRTQHNTETPRGHYEDLGI
jgi:hypothetical protein